MEENKKETLIVGKSCIIDDIKDYDVICLFINKFEYFTLSKADHLYSLNTHPNLTEIPDFYGYSLKDLLKKVHTSYGL